jgi:hypothetical protein
MLGLLVLFCSIVTTIYLSLFHTAADETLRFNCVNYKQPVQVMGTENELQVNIQPLPADTLIDESSKW